MNIKNVVVENTVIDILEDIVRGNVEVQIVGDDIRKFNCNIQTERYDFYKLLADIVMYDFNGIEFINGVITDINVNVNDWLEAHFGIQESVNIYGLKYEKYEILYAIETELYSKYALKMIEEDIMIMLYKLIDDGAVTISDIKFSLISE